MVKVDQFFEYVEQQAKHYRTNNIIMTMGGDFTYMDANVYYKNLDKLIRYVHVKYESSTKFRVICVISMRNHMHLRAKE